MKRWAFVVAALYLVILAVLTVPVALLAFVPQLGLGAVGVYLVWPYWLWLVVMAIAQFALLGVPARAASLRPVTRGPVWRTVLASGLMAGGLAVGAFLSIDEFVFADHPPNGNWIVWVTLILGLLTWCVWSVVFVRMSRSVPPTDWVSRQCRWLFKGSVLELLIAVPTHIVARWRDYCCAGMMTFVGLTMGISVMLFAFGPAVFFLYVKRWKRLHPGPQT
jgi:hypothetical protein